MQGLLYLPCRAAVACLGSVHACTLPPSEAPATSPAGGVTSSPESAHPSAQNHKPRPPTASPEHTSLAGGSLPRSLLSPEHQPLDPETHFQALSRPFCRRWDPRGPPLQRSQGGGLPAARRQPQPDGGVQRPAAAARQLPGQQRAGSLPGPPGLPVPQVQLGFMIQG